MTTNEIVPEESLEWLQAVGEDASAPDEALRAILRGPEPAPEIDEPISSKHVPGSFLKWLQTHGKADESPDEIVRRLRRGPKPLEHSREAFSADYTSES